MVLLALVGLPFWAISQGAPPQKDVEAALRIPSKTLRAGRFGIGMRNAANLWGNNEDPSTASAQVAAQTGIFAKGQH